MQQQSTYLSQVALPNRTPCVRINVTDSRSS